MRLSVQALVFFFLVCSVCSNSLPVFRVFDQSFDLAENDGQSRAVVNGGVLAAAGEFPYAVFLSLTNGMFVGGGTLIGSSHVLTSAQGLLTLAPSFMSMLRVTFNSTSTYGGVGAFLLPVNKVVVHELYNATASSDNNLALVVLSSPVTNLTFVTLPVSPTTIPPPTTTTSTTKVPTTKTPPPTTKPSQTTTKIPTTTKAPTTKAPTTIKVSPPTTKTPVPTTKTTAKITTTKPGPTTKTTAKATTKTTAKATAKPIVSQKPLAAVMSSSNRAFNSYANMSAVIAGWGSTTPGGNTAPLLLRKVNATILDNQSCTSYYGNNTFFGADMLCASISVPCMDDTGSPILVGGVQVGITMWCTGPAAGNYSGIYTRVTTYVDWIAKTMANNPGPVAG